MDGRTYGICAQRATCEIVNDLLAPVLIGADPACVEELWDALYGLMRVRGCTGAFISTRSPRSISRCAISSVASAANRSAR